ncbi:WD40 repeat-like protein [Coemansia reversa NRRL 1564]|uniref:Cleavage stimulation factor 50 kDa subunit n=1 Tax=Coemansia reversa (strain ATCC 12441 / NRRL 1564) TaxID=763665 RepID=A0A2G5B7D2_COERN|nr:WD40 repeat-like protein [Coemansia reversa NRRL 1564]|eukprot:PIA14894.1 WD40 repeat-like protein [Coemansia reversa NRRL 1564]
METQTTREEVIRLILCQLSAYGFANLSQAIATHTKVPMTMDSNSRLAELVTLGLQHERQTSGRAGTGPEMDTETEVQAEAAKVPHFQVWYKTKHKGSATTAAFSRDGRYIATGSADASLKLIDVDKVRDPSAGTARREDKPVIRTLYHHEAEVTGLAFHPNGLVLASCSADHSIKLFDLSAAYGKHSFQSFTDNFAFRTIAFHPSGEYIAAGGDAPEVRLYNVHTSKAYLLAAGNGAGQSQHTDSITQTCYSHSGSVIGSSSSDGTIKIWDGVSGRCVRTVDQAHDGMAVTAVMFSRNGKYAMSTGLDSCVRLWEVGSGRLVQTYRGASLSAANEQAVFSHDEALVMVPDARANSVVVWDAASGELLTRCAEHRQRITWIASSPTTPAFMSCSTDECVRYWSPGSV